MSDLRENSSESTSRERKEDSAPTASASEQPVASSRRRRPGLRWGLLIAAVFIGELAAYGFRGHLSVCVGKTPDVDFALMGQERTDENRWKFPRCEQRLNLGLKPGFEQRRSEAIRGACRGATLLRYKGEKDACVAAEGQWQHETTIAQCWPWHRHFIRHLFWFLPG